MSSDKRDKYFEEINISAWMPEREPVRLAMLAKIIEEATELAGRASRCIAQGLEGVDPVSGRTNFEELGREAADVTACIETAQAYFGIQVDADRVGMKVEGYRRWRDLIRNMIR